MTGTNFVSGTNTTVTFGGASATSVLVVGSVITCIAPAGSPGFADITVTSPDGQSFTWPEALQYNDEGPMLIISKIAPTSGPTTGGTPVTMTGQQFRERCRRYLRWNPGHVSEGREGNRITCVTPADDNTGPIDVEVGDPAPDGRASCVGRWI